MTSRLDKLLTLGFCTLWVIIIFIDYSFYHQGYVTAIQYFQYYDTLLLLSFIGIATFWVKYIMNNLNNHKALSFLKGGIGIYLLLILISGVILWTHYFKINNEFLGIIKGVNYLGKITYLLLAVYFIFGFCFILGDLFINNLFSFSLPKLDRRILNISIGVSLFSILLMLLGFINLLNFYVILILMIALFGLRWKATLDFLKITTLTPIGEKNKLNWIGFLSFFILLIFISLNLLNNVRPLPFGFDALAVYLNLPNLIGDTEGLVEGFSPYYWSLFTALGHIIFDKTEVAIAIASGGGILSLFALFAISRKWLDINYSLIIVLIFYSLPIINYQSFRDVKSDLGLLFILLSAFLVLMHWLGFKTNERINQNSIKNKKKKSTKKNKANKPNHSETTSTNKETPILAAYLSEPLQLIILLGILSGMALGTKLTALILIFSTLSVFSFIKGGKIGLLANFALTFFVILVANVDTTLRAYHFGTTSLQWVCFILGLLALGYVGVKNRSGLVSLLKVSLIYLFFTGIVYAPWPIKNYQETGIISFKTLTEGKVTGIPASPTQK